MPESDYTSTPPAATSSQSLMMIDKINALCGNMDKLSAKMEDIPVKLDRLATSVDSLGRENEKIRVDLDRTRSSFDHDIDKIKMEVVGDLGQIKAELKERDAAFNKTLEAIGQSTIKFNFILSIVAGSGLFILSAIGFGWNNMTDRVTANTLRVNTIEQSQKSSEEKLAQTIAKQSEWEMQFKTLQIDMYKRGYHDEANR